MTSLPRDRHAVCKGHVPAALDAKEPSCDIHYNWYRGEPDSESGPGLPERIEIMFVVVDGVDIYDYGDEESEATWQEAAWQDHDRATRRKGLR